MADIAGTTRKQSMQMAGVIAGTAFTFNAIFFIASSFYYAGKPGLEAELGSVRVAFAMFSVIVAVMAYAAAMSPRLIGHGLAAAIGLASFIAGMVALARGLTPVIGVTMLIVGAIAPVLVYKSWRHSRAAWSFLMAVIGVFGAVDFFGAPKVRALLGIGLWYAMIIPGIQIVCVMALAMRRDEYRS